MLHFYILRVYSEYLYSSTTHPVAMLKCQDAAVATVETVLDTQKKEKKTKWDICPRCIVRVSQAVAQDHEMGRILPVLDSNNLQTLNRQ